MDDRGNQAHTDSTPEAQTLRYSPSVLHGLPHARASGLTQTLRQWEPPPVAEIQTALPQYENISFLARGGMGAVYKGVQKALHRTVAIKILPAGMMNEDLQFVGRFHREAQAMAALSHPNIVTVYEAGETATGLLYFAMEYVAGTDVAELVARQGRLPPQEALRITDAICAALQCAHSHGIIHRDIKPSNVLLNERGEVKVADFGLAKVTAADGSFTQSMATVGTPDFLAPEAYIQGIVLDDRADIYSAGVMLYKMVTGHVPRGRFDAPSGEIRGIDRRLDRIIDKAMQADRDKRYMTAKEMRMDVARILGVGRVEAAAAPGRAQPAAFPPAARSKATFWISVIAILTMTVGGLWWSQSVRPLLKAASSPLPVAPATSWQNAFAESPLKEVIANVKHSTQGYLLPENNHWYIPSHSLRSGALRVRATSSAGHFVCLCLFLDDGRVVRIRYREQTKEWVMSEGVNGQKELDLPIQNGVSSSDGKPHEVLFARAAGHMQVRVDGELLHDTVEPNMEPGRFALTLFGDAHVFVDKVEYLDLDGIPETEALGLLSFENK